MEQAQVICTDKTYVMKLNTTKRSIKAQPLSHQEFDGNWQAIEDIINSNLPKNIYQIVQVSPTRVFEDGETIVTFNCKINVIEAIAILPIVKVWATMNNKLIGAGEFTESLETNQFPITNHAVMESWFEGNVDTTESEWPWPITIYVEDEQGNYAAPLSFIPTFEE